MTEEAYEPAAIRKARIEEMINRFEWGREEVPFSEVEVWAASDFPISEIDQWICTGVWKNAVAQKLVDAGLRPENMPQHGHWTDGNVLVLEPEYNYWAVYGQIENASSLGRTLSNLSEEKEIAPLIETLVEWRDDPRGSALKQLAALRDEAVENARRAKEGLDADVHLLGEADEGLSVRENEIFDVAKIEMSRVAFFTASSAAYEIGCKRLTNLSSGVGKEGVSKNLRSTANMLKEHAPRDPQKPDPNVDGILAASQGVRYLSRQVYVPSSENYEQLESPPQYMSSVVAAAQAKPAAQAVRQDKAAESCRAKENDLWQFTDRER